MATLIEFRQQNPEYNNVPDVALADALHQKFYADRISRPDFYKKLGLVGANIPGAENVTSLPKKEVSLRNRIMGVAETPALIAGNVISAVAGPVAEYLGENIGGTPTEFGMSAGKDVGKASRQMIGFTPLTETGPEITRAIGKFLGAIPPTPLTSAGTSLSTLMPGAINQLSPILRQAVVPAKNVLANTLTRQQPTMQGMGAAKTAEDLLREERLQRLKLPATAGERTKSLAQQQFEADVERGVVSGVSEAKKQELVSQVGRFREQQKQAITQKLESMAEQTGAKVADPTQFRQVGKLVDKAMVNEFDKKFRVYKESYAKADTAGETLQEVSYKNIIDFINQKTPTMRQKIDPILESVVESLKMNDPTKKGTISIRALEEVYQEVGKVKGSANAKELKLLIDQATEGAGGDLYRISRTQRRELANKFENVSRVDKLLGTKAGYADRQVAYEDIFKHVILDGSLEEMRTVTSLLKKAGPQGQQAYAELQGQTIQHLKDLLTKGDQMSFKNFNTAVNQLDFDDKLVYMYGKQGRQEIVDLRDALKDILVKQPGAVNYPNTAGAVLRGLEGLEAIRMPLAKQAAEFARGKQVTKRLEEALKQPNQLVTPSTSKNALRP
jgi:hypothetical protein